MDNLKAVNDNLGHDGGDTLIKLLSERMVKAVRDTDTVVDVGPWRTVALTPLDRQ